MLKSMTIAVYKNIKLLQGKMRTVSCRYSNLLKCNMNCLPQAKYS